MIGKTLSHFRIVDDLGEGGMGIVYRAEDTELQRVVALKVLLPSHVGDPERRARFIREAQTAAKVTHPNIATIYEVGEAEGNVFIAMELVEGQTLRDRLREGPISATETIELAIQIADGMANAHRAQVIHRDLKPDNIIVDEEGRAKILDFGLAKAFEIDEAGGDDVTMTDMLTREGRILGTAAYMSPEQARGKPLDARSDIFSLGIILYEMVTGRRPFDGETMTDILANILREEPAPLTQLNPQTPPEMGRIIAKCLEKKPAERYQDSRDMVVDLRRMFRDPATQSIISDPSLLSDPSRLASMPSGDPLGSGETPAGTGSQSVPSAPGFPTPPGMAPVSGPASTISGESVAGGASSKGKILAGTVIVAIFAAIIALVVGRNDGTRHDPANNNLAVMMFQNLKDSEDSDRLGQILQELLITELSDIDSLKVYSSQRLFDVHKQIGGSERPIFDPEMATQVAQKAGAGSMIQGSLSQLGNTWILTAQLVDLSTGTVSASQRIDGDDLYAMVDELGGRLRTDLQADPSFASNRADSGDSVREKTTSSLDAYRTYLVGNDLLEQQEFEMAADTLQRAVELDPTFGQAQYKLAMAMWWPGDNFEEAGNVLEDLLEQELYSSRKERLLAEATLELIRNDDKTRAIALYEQITDQFPEDKDAWYGLGEALFHNSPRLEDAALDAFRSATALDPGFGLAYRHILDILWGRSEYAQSIAEIQPLLEAHPNRPLPYEYWMAAASAWGNSEEVDKALSALRLIEIDRDHQQQVLVSAANGSLNRGDSRKAEQVLIEARALDPDNLELDWYMRMGQTLWNLNRLDELEDLVEEANMRFPDMPRPAQEGHMIVAFERGDIDEVFDVAEEILEDSPKEVEPRVYMAAAAANKKDWELYEDVVNETISSDLPLPAKRSFLVELSEGLADLNHHDRSRQCLEQAMGLYEDDEKTSNRMNVAVAWLDARTGRLDEAEAHYQSMIEHGDVTNGRYGLLYIALRRGETARAIELGELLHDGSAETTKLVKSMAIALCEERRYEDARHFAERAVEMDRSYSSHSILAWILVKGDIDVERGRAMAERIEGQELRRNETRWNFSLFPSPEHTIGLALLEQNRVSAAIEVLTRAKELRPDRPQIDADLQRAKEAL